MIFTPPLPCSLQFRKPGMRVIGVDVLILHSPIGVVLSFPFFFPSKMQCMTPLVLQVCFVAGPFGFGKSFLRKGGGWEEFRLKLTPPKW